MVHIFIVNSFAGAKKFSVQLRDRLAEMEGIEYYILHTRSNIREAELVRQAIRLFPDEKLRFYACGGSGTLRNLVNGLPEGSNHEVAFFPCGLTNDFLKVWEGGVKAFQDLKGLIEGETQDIDYIRTNHGIAVNTVSIGLDSDLLWRQEQFLSLSVFGNNAPYMLAVIFAILEVPAAEYRLSFDGEERIVNTSEIFFGNGGVLGGNLYFHEFADPLDGKGEAFYTENKHGAALFPCLLRLMKKKRAEIEEKEHCLQAKKMKFSRTDGKDCVVNMDGELVTGFPEWEVEIVPKGLHFVVPKGVRPLAQKKED